MVLACVVACTAAVAGVTARAPQASPAPPAIRAAVERSLPLLQSSADTWFARRQCASCHHQGLGLMAATVARERGVAIDEALLRGQFERTLRPRRDWQEVFVTAEPSINEAIGQSYRAVGLGTAGGTRTAMTDAISYLLAGRQHESGRWSSYSRRPPLEDSEFTATAYTVRTLRLFPLKGREAEFDARVGRARTWLRTARPADTEDRAMQLLGLAWAGVESSELTPYAEALLREQRADGGWAQIATRESDAYATGQAIVALNQTARVPIADPRIQRGLAYLLATQGTDGSWRVATRRTVGEGLPYFESGYPHGKDQFISYAGGAWATIALSLALRDQRSPALTGQPPAASPVSIDAGEPDGLTPLMRAALYGTLADVDHLLAAGHDANAASPDGVTALMCAVHDADKVRRLLAAGANPRADTRRGHTALLLAAAYSGASATVDLLLARDVKIDRPTTAGTFEGATPLTRALARGDTVVASALFARGARVNAPSAGALSPLMMAAWYGDAGMAAWLAARGAVVDAPVVDDDGMDSTPLMVAVEEGRAEVVEALVSRGAQVNRIDKSGLSPLHMAAHAIDRGTTDIVDILLNAGASRSIATPAGESAAVVARKWAKPHIAARIEQP